MPYSGPLRGGVRDVEHSMCQVGPCRDNGASCRLEETALLCPGPGGNLAAGPRPPAPARPLHQALCPRFTLLSSRRWLLNCFCFPFRTVILFSSSFPFCMQSQRRTDAQQTCADPASVASPLRSSFVWTPLMTIFSSLF